MNSEKIIDYIVLWLKEYSVKSNTKGFIIGISGGVDSAVTSILASKTGLPVICVDMPIHQNQLQINRGQKHINWLKEKHPNVDSDKIDLTNIFDELTSTIIKNKNKNLLALANSRARLRMITLYYIAQDNNYIVVGTGNKVEDFGIGFFTKYGDGGVDISPIADLLKTEVYELARILGVSQEILEAEPTDGLWENNQTDEDQIGATYEELEWAMNYTETPVNEITDRQKEVLKIYTNFNRKNKHKMTPIPICKIPKEFK